MLTVYGFEIWFDGNCIREFDEYDTYCTEIEALEASEEEIDYIINFEEGYNEGDRYDFSVKVIEIETDIEED